MMIQQPTQPLPITRAAPATSGSVHKLLQLHPRLHIDGRGRPQRGALYDARAQLMAQGSIVLINEAMTWLLAHTTPQAMFNRTHTSYGLKAIIESDTGTSLTNGQVIAAALLTGYHMDRDTYNPHFNWQLKDSAKLSAHRKPLLPQREGR